MSETLVLGGMPEAEAVPQSAEVQAMATEQDSRARGMATTAIEEIMRTDPAAKFEYPAGMSANRGVSYTPPSGDA